MEWQRTWLNTNIFLSIYSVGCPCLVTQSCPTLCNPMDCSTPGFPVLHHLLEFAQTQFSRVGDAIQPSCPLSSPLSSCLQSFPISGTFPMSRLFSSGGQIIETSASASVLPMDIQGWFPLGLIGLISLLSKGLSRVFSSTTVQKHQFFSTHPSLWSNSHIVHDYQKSHIFDYMDLCWQSNVSAF